MVHLGAGNTHSQRRDTLPQRVPRSRVRNGVEVNPGRPGREPHSGGQAHLEVGMEKNWETLYHVVGGSEVHKAQSPGVSDWPGSGSPLQGREN